jgi:hypothetical protein
LGIRDYSIIGAFYDVVDGMITVKDLDKRICDIEKDSGNDETFREFIINTENDFDLIPKDIDNMSDEQLNEYIEWLDYLWTK